jgi:hypothetical protein
MEQLTILRCNTYSGGRYRYRNTVQYSNDGRMAIVRYCGQGRSTARMVQMNRDHLIHEGALIMIQTRVKDDVTLLGRVVAVQWIGVTTYKGAHVYKLTVERVQPTTVFPCNVPQQYWGPNKPRHMWKALMKYTGMSLQGAMRADARKGIFQVVGRDV